MKTKLEILAGIIVLIILIGFLNPTKLLMPDSLIKMLMVALILIFLFLIGLVWQEVPEDERDTQHISKSGRYAFIGGSIVLVLGISLQALRHSIDPWLLYALATMVLIKIISRLLHRIRN
jgi:Na+/H+ antiporter NhaD/arsenite permease-like protein